LREFEDRQRSDAEKDKAGSIKGLPSLFLIVLPVLIINHGTLMMASNNSWLMSCGVYSILSSLRM
jgi:hypothetical protein